MLTISTDLTKKNIEFFIKNWQISLHHIIYGIYTMHIITVTTCFFHIISYYYIHQC